MKKFLIASNILLLCFIGFQGLNQKSGVNLTDKLNMPADSCLTKLCLGYSNIPGQELRGLISRDLAIKMAGDYNAELGKKYIWNGTTMTREEDARSVVFDLLTLKKYIWYIESNTCQKGCYNGKLQLGIRFYYAKYPGAKFMAQDGTLKTLDASYANRHTLFMVPVYRYLFARGIYQNFNPVALNRDCKFLWDSTGGFPGPAPVLIMAAPSGDESEQNHGSLRPPPAGSAIFPEN